MRNIVGKPVTHSIQVGRGFRTIDILHRVGVNIASDEAATQVEAVVIVGIGIVTTQGDGIVIHHAVRTVGRVTALAAAVTTEAVVEHDHATFTRIAVLVVNGLRSAGSGTAPAASKVPI